MEGYLTDSSNLSATGSVMTPAPTPVRICDTRSGNPSGLSGAALSQCEGKTLKAGSTLTISAAGLGGVPTDATAVIVNITVTDTTAPSYLTAYPAGTTWSLTSVTNWQEGETIATNAIVPIGSGGRISLYNHTGNVDVIVDVVGWSVPAGT